MENFVGIEWKKGESRSVQGIKGNRQPYGAIYGGNGSFRVYDTPAELILTVKNSAGENQEQNVMDIVKDANGWQKLSEKRVSRLKTMLKKKQKIDVNNLEKELRL